MKRMAIIKTIAVGAVALSLAGGALASDISVRVAGANAANNDGASTAAAEHATLSVDLPAVATHVMEVLAGGSNPSTMNKHDKAPKAEAKDNEVADNDEAAEAAEVEAPEVEVEHGQKLGQTGTAGTKPGFGCGDKNHEHSGPPGNPSKKGCENHDNHDNDNHDNHDNDQDKHKNNKH
jgi:hypothetical protein